MKHNFQAIVAGTVLSLLTAGSALAQTGPGIVLQPFNGDGVLELSGSAFYAPTEANVTGADVDLAIFDAQGRIRLDPDASYKPTIGFDFTQFGIDTTDAALPDRLVDASFAFGGSFGKVDMGDTLGEWEVGYTVGAGYAGTAPFNDGNAWYLTGNLFAVKVIDRDTRWLVGLNYDGNRVFLPDVPLPAVTYFGRASETVTYGMGFPFSSLTWKPTDRWKVDIRSLLFFSLNATVSYTATDDLAFYAAYVQRNDAFTVSGSPSDRRLLFSQQRVELGAIYELTSGVGLTLAGGYAFDQEFDFGYDSREAVGVRDLDDAAFIRAGVVFMY